MSKAQSDEHKGLVLKFYRAYPYWLQGFGFVSLHLQIIRFSSVIYLAIKDFLPFGYPEYMGIVLTFGVPAIMGLGYSVYHYTHFYSAQQIVQNSNSPYAHFKINPIDIPRWEIYRELAYSLNKPEIAEKIEEILKRNGVSSV